MTGGKSALLLKACGPGMNKSILFSAAGKFVTSRDPDLAPQTATLAETWTQWLYAALTHKDLAPDTTIGLDEAHLLGPIADDELTMLKTLSPTHQVWIAGLQLNWTMRAMGFVDKRMREAAKDIFVLSEKCAICPTKTAATQALRAIPTSRSMIGTDELRGHGRYILLCGGCARSLGTDYPLEFAKGHQCPQGWEPKILLDDFFGCNLGDKIV
jgi:hypothetical protein